MPIPAIFRCVRRTVMLVLLLAATGLSAATVNYNATTDALTFTASAGISDNVTVTTLSATSVRILVGDFIILSGDAVANLDFALSSTTNPNDTLTINTAGSPVVSFLADLGDLDDVLVVNLAAFGSAVGGITVQGQVGTDTLTIQGSVTATFASDAETVNLNTDVAITGSANTVNVDDNPSGKIQTAINLVAAAGTVNVAAGTYIENLTLNKSINLRGAQFGVDARGRVAAESIVEPVVVATRTLAVTTGVAGAVIDGFTFSTGTRCIESTGATLNNLQISNNRIIAFTNSGIFLNDTGTDITINQNVIDGTNKIGGVALLHLDTDVFNGMHITNNNIVNGTVTTGFFVDGNHNVGPSAGRTPLLSGNLIQNNNVGVNLGTRAFGAQFTLNAGTISLNTFDDNNFDGLQGGMQNVLITQNTFSNNGRTGLTLTSFGNTGADRGAQNTQITQNFFTGNATEDILFSSTQAVGTIATNTVSNNSIASARGVTYNGAETINVSGNWWGTNGNPETATRIGGTGAGNIDYSPWLDMSTDTSVAAGFQGDFSTLHVDDESAQFGVTGRITEALGLATATGALLVEAGTYAEAVTLAASQIIRFNGNATINSLTASAGTINLQTFALTTGNVGLAAGATLAITVNDSAAGSHGELNVTGTVNLGGAALNATGTIAATQTVALIANDGADAIAGTFAGIPQGSLVTINGVGFIVSYAAGDGNDAVFGPSGAIGNFVFRDLDEDGVQDAGEFGLANVTVELLDSGGGLLTTVQTDGTGAYSFPNLLPANYAVRFTAPAGHIFSPQDQGGDDTLDSDANPGNGTTAQFALAAVNNSTVDCGLIDLNSAPAGADVTLTATEDTAFVFTAANFGFSDPSDTPAHTLLAVKIGAIAGGTLTNGGTAVNAADVVTAAAITGGSLVFTPAQNVNGAAAGTITFQVQDNGGIANGGVDLDASPNTVTFNVTAVNDAPTITSAPTATPSTAGVGQTVAFAVAAADADNDTLTFTWNFDGTTGTGATLTHAFMAAGVYTVTVTVTDGNGGSVAGSVTVTVNAPTAGSGSDSDGDGFSDSFETAAGTDPNNAADSPTGGVVPVTADLTQAKLTIKLNFAKAASDSISFSGTLPIAAGFNPANQKVTIDVGGAVKAVTLDAKGKSTTFKVGIKSKKGVVAAQTAKYSVKFSKGDFAAAFADEGFTSTAATANADVVVRLIFGGVVYQHTQAMTYKGKPGKSGSASAPK